MNDGLAAQLAGEFWTDVGSVEPFPRSLEASVLWALPLAVLKFPRLLVSDVQKWLRRQNFNAQVRSLERSLRACLVAYGGKGILVLDASDPEEERRFSLAHEVAHFMLDYWKPRQRAINKLGLGIIKVLDGFRPPTVEEKVHGILSEATTGVHTHLMTRNPDGSLPSLVEASEKDADRLALELLAPADMVVHRARCSFKGEDYVHLVGHLTDILVQEFGLPQPVAGSYASYLSASRMGLSVREWLGIRK